MQRTLREQAAALSSFHSRLLWPQKLPIVMEINQLEAKIVELKAKQGDYFKQKKAQRNPAEIEAIRQELNSLKSQVAPLYRKAK